MMGWGGSEVSWAKYRDGCLRLRHAWLLAVGWVLIWETGQGRYEDLLKMVVKCRGSCRNSRDARFQDNMVVQAGKHDDVAFSESTTSYAGHYLVSIPMFESQQDWPRIRGNTRYITDA
jgi:hypothetical protein